MAIYTDLTPEQALALAAELIENANRVIAVRESQPDAYVYLHVGQHTENKNENIRMRVGAPS